MRETRMKLRATTRNNKVEEYKIYADDKIYRDSNGRLRDSKYYINLNGVWRLIDEVEKIFHKTEPIFR